MVEDVRINFKNQDKGKGKNKWKNLSDCLAVCDVSPGRVLGAGRDVSMGLGLLVSELSQVPAWKGKVINFSRNPQLHSIRGHDLKSKCEFVSKMDRPDWEVDFRKALVFDLIRKVAVSENLKPEQRINTVFVFTSLQSFDEASAIQSKFKEKGYAKDAVPHLVFWDVFSSRSTPVPCTKPGGGHIQRLQRQLGQVVLGQ